MSQDLSSVTATFNRLKKSGVVLKLQVYNCHSSKAFAAKRCRKGYLDACVQCQDIEAALRLFEDLKSSHRSVHFAGDETAWLSGRGEL